ncbi:MAG: DUF1858 domain-containing protein [Sphaerochaetaceae bacterium]|jgi:threonyl-tRNA synthetase
MEEKIIDLEKSVHSLCSKDPNLIKILAEIGFSEIVKPIMLNSVGRVMTLPKGAAMRSIDLNYIIQTLKEHGYKVVDTSQKEIL